MIEKDATYIPPLTGLRILAAWIIFFHHINPVADTSSFGYSFLKEGYLSLTIFFVLSGFIIANRYEAVAEANWRFLRRYFYLRFIRIYPVFWLVTTATFLLLYLYHHQNPPNWKSYWLSISFLKGFSDSYKFWGISQTWSLTVEECFYACAPLLFILYKRHRYFVRSLLLVYGMGIAFYALTPSSVAWFETPHFMLYYTFWGRAFDFFAGYGLYLWIRKHPNWQTRTGLLTYSGAAGYCLITTIMALMEIYQTHNEGSVLLLQNYLLPSTIAVWIAGLIHENTLLSRWLSAHWMQQLGKASYCFYLLHLGVLTKLLDWLNVWQYFLLINVLAWLVYRCVEHPIHQFLKTRAG
jgi:peptidoglycan/LPS O-acetylase OafA/YrhL